ncbi:MAG: sigma-70 family RNA polymerase sigma factor [Polyangiaceae bacterium]
MTGPGAAPEKKAAANSPDVVARVGQEIDAVPRCARRVRASLGLSASFLDDLEAFGREGLLEAARSYEPERGVPFKNWAYLKMRAAMLDGLRRESAIPRRAYAQIKAMRAAGEVREGSLEDESAAANETSEAANERVKAAAASMATAMAMAFLSAKHDPDAEADTKDSPEALTAEKLLLEQVKAAIDEEPENARHILTRVYFGDVSLEEAGAEIGLSKSWTSRTHARALESVTARLKAREREE